LSPAVLAALAGARRESSHRRARLALWDRDEARLEGASTSLKGIADVEAILYEQGELGLGSTGGERHACPVQRD
jgi:hypothetical protein